MKPLDKIKYVIIANGSGDGLCASAIAVNKLKDPIDIYFSQTFTINGLLHKLIKTENMEKIKIYIIDLHVNNDTTTLLKRFSRVVYINHNPKSMYLKGMYPGKIDKYKSSSQLAAEYFSNLKSPLATLGMVCDKLLSLPASDTMLKESILLQKSIAYSIDDDKFRKYLVEQLALGLLPSHIPDVLTRSQCTNDKLNDLLEQANGNILEVENPRCAIVTINENIKGFSRQVAGRLIAKRDYPVFLLYPDMARNKIIIIARNNQNYLKIKEDGDSANIDLAQFMKIYFSGGGHPNAAGGAIDGIHPGVKMVEKCFKEFMGV